MDGLVSVQFLVDDAPTLLDYFLNVPALTRDIVRKYVLELLYTSEMSALISLLVYSLLHSYVGGESLATTMQHLRSEKNDVMIMRHHRHSDTDWFEDASSG